MGEEVSRLKDELQGLIGKPVVVDTKSPYLYIGTLSEVKGNSLILTDVDVHDSNESSSSKELYVIQTLKTGIRVSRKSAYILLNQIVSLSPLSDVVEY